MSRLTAWTKTFRLGVLGGLVALISGSSSLGQTTRLPAHKAEQPKMPETRDLYPIDTIPFSAPPPRMVGSGIKCDLKGNIYLVYTDAPQVVLSQRDGVATLPISELSPGSRSVARYEVPSIQDHHHVLRYGFNVDARGRVYALMSAAYNTSEKEKPRGDYFIVRYKDEGSVDSYFKIGDKPGEHLQPIHLAAFPDGNFLVTGTSVKPEGFGVFSAVFDRAGTFASNVEVRDDLEVLAINKPSEPAPQSAAPAAPRTPPANGADDTGQADAPTQSHKSRPNPVDVASSAFALSAPDGNIYLLRGTDPAHLYVVSPSGSVVREFEVPRPAPGLSPIQMAMAGDSRIFFEYAHVATGAPGENNSSPHLITEMDPNTGELTAVYRLAPADTGFHLAGCASSPYDFLFVGTSKDKDNEHLEVVRYSPR
jgi:hypothetical protein